MNDSSLRIVDGTVKAKGGLKDKGIYPALVDATPYGNETVQIEGGTFESDFFGIRGADRVIINGGKFKTNGTAIEGGNSIINKGDFEVSSTLGYGSEWKHPVIDGTAAEINGGKLTAKRSLCAVKATTVTVTGGTIEALGDSEDVVYMYPSSEDEKELEYVIRSRVGAVDGDKIIINGGKIYSKSFFAVYKSEGKDCQIDESCLSSGSDKFYAFGYSGHDVRK